ncbi:hypothetical protein [Pseudonocardia dioxanivorans]|uniref:hypothetical protein n=1 Tax=Pseudonocardia dioxanivorans TaxID=240495 RepID=UPI00030D8576|nr:hypothetical protein [Pseudonocardia dioxanivorans]
MTPGIRPGCCTWDEIVSVTVPTSPSRGLAFGIASDTVLATLARRDRHDAAIAEMATTGEFAPVMAPVGVSTRGVCVGRRR